MRQRVISVFGSSAAEPDSETFRHALAVGGLLARAGLAVQTGGYGGVMAAASRSASEAGGHVIGVTSGRIEAWEPRVTNRWVAEEVRHPDLRGRLAHLIERCDGAIVLPGGVGTLAELGLVWNLVLVGELPPRPIVVLGAVWSRVLEALSEGRHLPPAHRALVTAAATPERAVEVLLAGLASAG